MRQAILKEVCLEITDVCPMECIHCSNFDGSPIRGFMSLSQIKKIIDEANALGGTTLNVSGGEPLMHPNIFDVISYAKTRGLRTALYTSGLISHSEASSISPDIARKLDASGLDAVIFSLHGATSRTHESITGTHRSFEKTVESIKNTKSRGIWVGVHFVPMKPNCKDLRNLVQLCNHLKVDEVGFLRFVPQGRGRENRKELELSKDEFFELTLETTRLKRASQGRLKIRVGRPLNFCPLMDSSGAFELCNAGKTRCLIKPNGDVVPCPAFKQNRNYVAGNVENESLLEIWNNSPIWKQFRRFDHQLLRGYCKTCPHLNKCQGRCVAQRILKNGDIYEGPDPHCPIGILKETFMPALS